MGEIEFGKCEICGKEAPLERTYFYYPIHCECCGSKDENGQKQHFVMVVHCKDCPAPMPKEIHPLLKSMHGEEHRANITNILPTEIRGQFIINDKIIKEKQAMWIARDESGKLFMYSTKPFKRECTWGFRDKNTTVVVLSDSLFPEVKWEDKAPRELILK